MKVEAKVGAQPQVFRSRAQHSLCEKLKIKSTHFWQIPFVGQPFWQPPVWPKKPIHQTPVGRPLRSPEAQAARSAKKL